LDAENVSIMDAADMEEEDTFPADFQDQLVRKKAREEEEAQDKHITIQFRNENGKKRPTSMLFRMKTFSFIL